MEQSGSPTEIIFYYHIFVSFLSFPVYRLFLFSYLPYPKITLASLRLSSKFSFLWLQLNWANLILLYVHPSSNNLYEWIVRINYIVLYFIDTEDTVRATYHDVFIFNIKSSVILTPEDLTAAMNTTPTHTHKHMFKNKNLCLK